MGGGEAPPEGEGAEGSTGGGVTFEGGHERADEPSSEPNFNRDGGDRRERSGGGVLVDAQVVDVVDAQEADAAVTADPGAADDSRSEVKLWEG